MPKPKSPQPLSRVLAADATLAGWDARRKREEALLAALRRRLPRPVGERVFVADGSGAILELATGAGALATVLRQKGPELLQQLAREGWEFTGIRVRVQPRFEPEPPAKAVPRQWDSASRRPLAALAAGLPEGPLRTALLRFLRNAG
jgi:hypothetical protein